MGEKTALFKNIYLDLSYLNPFKKKVLTNQSTSQASTASEFATNQPETQLRELPAVSRRLIEDTLPRKSELPKIRKTVMPPPNITQPVPVSGMRENAPVVPPPPYKAEAPLQDPLPQNNDFGKSYFNTLSGHLHKEEHLPGHVLHNNHFEEMQKYWNSRKDELDRISVSNTLKADLVRKMSELHEMETEWQKLQLAQEKLKDTLVSKEILIENSIRHLKRSFKKLHHSASIRPEHYFVLANGNRLRSLHELEKALHSMEAWVFDAHVNESKNDFSNWIDHVIGLPDLAQSLRKAKTKGQAVDLIENWRHST
jgi:hypothetical protein